MAWVSWKVSAEDRGGHLRLSLPPDLKGLKAGLLCVRTWYNKFSLIGDELKLKKIGCEPPSHCDTFFVENSGLFLAGRRSPTMSS